MPFDPRSRDLDLVRGALAGRREAERALLERLRCVPRILAAQNERFGRPLPPDELEDVAQETLVAVWRKLARFDGRAALETWVHAFCTNELLRRLRAKRRGLRLLEDDLEGSTFEPVAPPAPSALDFEHVLAGLEALPPELAAVLRLKHFEDLTFEELGRCLDISPNTAKTRYYRGLDALRARLGRRAREPEESAS